MHYEEISLKELILILIKGWKWIGGITLITTLGALIFTFGVKPELYESSSSFNVKIPASVETQYGTFTFPSTNVNDYLSTLTSDDVLTKTIDELKLDLAVADLRTQLSFTYDANQSISTVNTKVTFKDPKLASEIHKVWLETYQDVLSENYQSIAANQLLANLEANISALNKEQTALRDELIILNTYKESLPYTIGVSIDNNADNYIYYQVVLKIMNLEIRDYEITSTREVMNQHIKELESIIALNQTDDLNVLKGLITLPTQIIEPVDSIDRGIALNTAIGFVLGVMMGVFVVFFINYWKSEA